VSGYSVIRTITTKIFRAKKSLNILRQSYALKTNVTYEVFMNNLIEVGYVELNDSFYSIHKNYQIHASNLVNNKMMPAGLSLVFSNFTKLVKQST